MLQNKKTIGYVVAGLLLLTGIIFWLFKTSPVNEKPVKTSNQVVAPHELKDTSLQEDKDGKQVWKLNIKSLITDNARGVNVLRGIDGTFYREDGSTLHLTADEGEISLNDKTIVLTKNPHGTTSTGADLVATKVVWLNAQQIVIAEGDVKLTREDTIATAKKATMDMGLEKVKLEGEAKVRKGVTQA